jgi:hypothetical protein
MSPILLSFHAPIHDLEEVGRHVVKEGVAPRLRGWKTATGARELFYLATCQRVLWILWGGDPEALGLGSEVKRYEGEAAWNHLLGLSDGQASVATVALRHLEQAMEPGARVALVGMAP